MADVSISVALTGVGVVTQGIGRIGRGLTNVSRRLGQFGTSLNRIGTGLTLGLTLPLGAASFGLIKLASDAVETENLFEVSMGNMADAATKFTEDFSTSLGLNRFELQRQVATLQDITTAMGFTEEAAFLVSSSLTALAQDLASFKNLRTEEAFDKLRAGIVGETEPLKAIGVLVDETTVKNTLMREGIIETSRELTQQEKVFGRYLAILSQTGNAQGDLARTLESPSNQMRILRNRVTETSIEFGKTLLPIFSIMLTVINRGLRRIEELIDRFKTLSDRTKTAAVGFVVLAIAIGPALKLLGTFLKTTAAIIAVFKTLGLLVGGIAGGIVALGAATAFVLLQWKDFANEGERLWLGIRRTVQIAVGNMANDLAEFTKTIPGIGEVLSTSFREASRLAFQTVVNIDTRLNQLADSTEGRNFGTILSENLGDAALSVGVFAGEMVDSFLSISDAAKGTGQDIRGIGSFQQEFSFDDRRDAIKALFEEGNLLAEGFSSNLAKTSTGMQKLVTEVINARGPLDSLKGQIELINAENRVLVGEGVRSFEKLKEVNEQNAEVFRAASASLTAWSKETENANATQEQTAEVFTQLLSLHQELITAQEKQLELTQGLTEEDERRIEVATRTDEALIIQIGRLGELEEATRQADEAETKRIEDGIKNLTSLKVDALGVAQSMNRSFQQFFFSVLSGTKSFGDAMKDLFKGLVDSILQELARLAANAVFSFFISAALGGLTGGTSFAASGAGGLGTAAGGGGGFLGGLFGGGGGGLFSGLFQRGGEIQVQRPTLFVAGEQGPEQVSIRPFAGMAGRSEQLLSGIQAVPSQPRSVTVQVMFNGNTVLDDLAADEFGDGLATRVVRELNRVV